MVGTQTMTDNSMASDLLSTSVHSEPSPNGKDSPSYTDDTEKPRGRKEFEEYDEDDARAMSPRRSVAELERIGSEAKALLEEQAKALQSGLIALLDRVDKVKEEHDKLEAENRFLQEYIGSLMATSKITGSTPGNRTSRSGTGRVK